MGGHIGGLASWWVGGQAGRQTGWRAGGLWAGGLVGWRMGRPACYMPLDADESLLSLIIYSRWHVYSYESAQTSSPYI